MVEFAVVLPIMFLFFFAMIEIGRLLLLQHTVDTAAYEGARNAMVPGATADEARNAAQQIISSAGLRSATITVSPSVLLETTPLITVRVDVPIEGNSWGMPRFLSQGNVTSEVTLLCERPPVVQLTALPQIKSMAAKLKGKPPSL